MPQTHRSKFPDVESIDAYTDIISGVNEHDGEQYRELYRAIENDDCDLIFVHKLSRLFRVGAGEIHRFIQHCMEWETAVESLDIGLSIHVDDSRLQRTIYTMIASIMGDLVQIEHKQKLQRIQFEFRAAKRSGTWTGRPPRGFDIDEDGTLHVDMDDFLEIREALLRLDRGERKTIVAKNFEIPRSTLTRLFENDEHRALYLDGVATDDRLDRALNKLRPFPDPTLSGAKRASNIKPLSDIKPNPTERNTTVRNDYTSLRRTRECERRRCVSLRRTDP